MHLNLTTSELNKFGHSLDLDDTTKVYLAMKANRHWMDYSYPNGEGWDEDRYYSDFNKYWDSLPRDTKETFYRILH